MFQYHCLNPIAERGLNMFSEDYTKTENINEADAVLVRSARMHDMELGDSVKAIARAGAGVNNIPVDACAEQGIVVFNTPGANANGVKELVIAGMLLASRDIVGGIEWVAGQKDKENIDKLAEKQKKQFAGCEISGKKLGIIGLGALEPWLPILLLIWEWRFTAMIRIFPLTLHGIFPEPSNTANPLMRSTASAITLPFMCRFLTAHAK